MERFFGTVSRGVRAPIIKNGDDIVKVVTESVLSSTLSDETKNKFTNRTEKLKERLKK